MKQSGMLLFALIIGMGLILIMGPLVASALGEPPAGTVDPDSLNLPNITYEQNGQTVRLRTGEGFLLRLGPGYVWTVTIDNPAVVTENQNIPIGQEVQGIYHALAPGQTALTALGKPVCPQNNLTCNQPDRAFRVDLIVD